MKRGKKAQEAIGMSFSTIFSIILIIFFIVVAFIAIKYFLDMKKCTQVGFFITDLQDNINTAWNSQQANFEFTGTLPSDIKYVCFANTSLSLKGETADEINLYKYEDSNMFFYPAQNACDVPNYKIEHININKIISSNKNPYCIKNPDGIIKIKIEKSFSDALVSLK
jgi:hypothetical protein